MARPKKTSAKPVDETVANQENPGSSETERPSTETNSQPEVAVMAPAQEVDEPVANQENPGTSETERPSTEVEQEYYVPEMAPAMEVDETVVNQEHPGTSAVNRDPEPQLVTDEAGVTFDMSKTPVPEIVEDASREAEKNRIRQSKAVLDAREGREDDKNFFSLEFVESGLTYAQRVWKKGEVVEVPKSRQKAWMDLSASEQEERWGHVKFEKR
jgi:hypothetical protein